MHALKIALLGAALASLSACDSITLSDAQKACEDELIGKLNAPSTYKRISIKEYHVPADGDPQSLDVTRVNGPRSAHAVVYIESDAANGFGVPIRGTYSCVFVSDGKKADTLATIDAYLAAYSAMDDVRAGRGDKVAKKMYQEWLDSASVEASSEVLYAYAIDFYAEPLPEPEQPAVAQTDRKRK